MAILFNQSSHPLKWDMSAVSYSCEPWGRVEVPDELAQACVRMGLPLKATQIAPEVRAQRQIAQAEQDTRADSFAAIRKEADAAIALAKSEKEERERIATELGSARGALTEAAAVAEKLRQELRDAKADREAALKQADQMGKRAAEAEEKAIRLAAELKSLRESAAAPQKQQHGQGKRA